MAVTRKMAADHLVAYLRRQTSLEQLVDWAEQQMMEGEFELPSVRDAVAQMGLADVRAFGLEWEDVRRILTDLGFSANIEISAAS